MPHYYATSGTPIQLDEARTTSACVSSMRRTHDGAKAVRALSRAEKTSVRHQRRSRRRPSALRPLHAAARIRRQQGARGDGRQRAAEGAWPSRVARTMPVFVERESKLQTGRDRPDPGLRSSRRPRPRAGESCSHGLGLHGRRAQRVRSLGARPGADFRAPGIAHARSRERTRGGRRRDRIRGAELSRADAEGLGERPAVRGAVASRQSRTGNGIALQDARALGAWELVGGGKRSIVIAIIDDGVDLDHPDLKAQHLEQPVAPREETATAATSSTTAIRYNPRPKVFNAPFDDTATNDIHGTPVPAWRRPSATTGAASRGWPGTAG